jgi:hypothetical protein
MNRRQVVRQKSLELLRRTRMHQVHDFVDFPTSIGERHELGWLRAGVRRDAAVGGGDWTAGIDLGRSGSIARRVGTASATAAALARILNAARFAAYGLW